MGDSDTRLKCKPEIVALKFISITSKKFRPSLSVHIHVPNHNVKKLTFALFFYKFKKKKIAIIVKFK